VNCSALVRQACVVSVGMKFQGQPIRLKSSERGTALFRATALRDDCSGLSLGASDLSRFELMTCTTPSWYGFSWVPKGVTARGAPEGPFESGAEMKGKRGARP